MVGGWGGSHLREVSGPVSVLAGAGGGWGFWRAHSGAVCAVAARGGGVLLCGGGGGGLCVPSAPGPRAAGQGAGEPYSKAAGGDCGSGDLRLPLAHG